MNRWWADSQSSRDALALVDDSDVVNGVGVAVLGYHGLVQNVLKPLANSTLIDVHHVHEVLSGVDLEPISKALGNATKPVMGDASKKYGELLAEAIHKQAVEATERLITTWTNGGMPWPNAIERAAEVHGVPLDRLGKYATVMKSATVQPIVREDYADRELMNYASTLGNREALMTDELISKQNFNEREHPRGEGGRFTDKPDGPKPISEISDRRARRDRRDRRDAKDAKDAKYVRDRQVGKPAVTQDRSTQSNLKDLFKPASSVRDLFKPKPQETSAPVLESRGYENREMKSRAYEGMALTKMPTNFHMGAYDSPPGEKTPPYVIADMELYCLIPKTIANSVVSQSGSFYTGLAIEFGLTGFTKKDLSINGKYLFGDVTARTLDNDYYMVRIPPGAPVNADMPRVGSAHNDDKGFDVKEIVPNARFTFSNINRIAPNGYIENARLEPYEINGFGTGLYLETIDVELANEGQFVEPVGPNIYKNLDGEQLQDFNNEHPRGEGGRFKDKTRTPEDRKARRERRDRRDAKDAKYLAESRRLAESRKVAAQKPEAKLSDLKSAFKPKQDNVKDLFKPKNAEKVLESRGYENRQMKSRSYGAYAINESKPPEFDEDTRALYFSPGILREESDVYGIYDNNDLMNFADSFAKQASSSKAHSGDYQKEFDALFAYHGFFAPNPEDLKHSVIDEIITQSDYYMDDWAFAEMPYSYSKGADFASFADPNNLEDFGSSPSHLRKHLNHEDALLIAREANRKNVIDKRDTNWRSFQTTEYRVVPFDGDSTYYKVEVFEIPRESLVTIEDEHGRQTEVDASNCFTIILGSKEELESLASGNGIIEQIDDVYDLTDLLSLRTPDVDLEFMEDAGEQDIISNPPVNAFRVKMLNK